MKKIMNLMTILASLSLLVACGPKEGPVNQLDQAQVEEGPGADQAGDDKELEEDQTLSIQVHPHNPSHVTALVNKDHSLPKDYAPSDLVQVQVPTVFDNSEANQLRQEAADQLVDLFQDASDQGFELLARSGYRSYATQADLFANYVQANGLEAAQTFSAQAGTSEHQTGLAMDITSPEVDYALTESYIDTEPGQWLANNAHRFGFIMRYPQGKEDITGYQFEPWHYRYFGPELASYLFENDLTYEEFLAEDEVADIID